jgi:asparagine synthase (glutamine-hydrolysing)
MFAIAIWDARNRELLLFRDRLGIKPLYYTVHHGRLNFASEIKALLADPEQIRRVHETSLYHFLTFLTAPAPDTLFEGIFKLPCGHWLRCREDGSIEVRRYWDVWDETRSMAGVSEQEIGERLLAELREAVSIHKVSDVPMGVFLSGGIDSTTNAYLFSEGEHAPIKTFTIGYAGDNPSYRNETEPARFVAGGIGADYHEQLLTEQDLLDFMPAMTHLQDEPIADPVCVPVYYVSQLARRNGVIVCHVGEGADELFCGYPFWKTQLQFQQAARWPVPRFARKTALGLLSMAGLGRTTQYEMIRRIAEGVPAFWGGANAFTLPAKTRLLSPRLRARFRNFSSWEALRGLYAHYEEKAWEQHPLHWMTWADINVRLPELLLMRVDKMGMGVSVESRVPFLDHKVVELALSIPADLLLKQGDLKHILKRAVRGVIPDQIVDRKKQGFGLPLAEWFSTRLGGSMRQELARLTRETDYFDPAEIDHLFRTGDSTRLWHLYNFALWWDRFIAERPGNPT